LIGFKGSVHLFFSYSGCQQSAVSSQKIGFHQQTVSISGQQAGVTSPETFFAEG
jgi:hypothetical protein